MRRIRPTPTTPGGDWREEFDAALAKSGLARLSLRSYRHDLKLFIEWLDKTRGGKTPLARLSGAEILSYRQHLVNVERLKPSTVNQRLQAIRHLCRWAARQGLLATDPSVEVKSLRIAARRRPAGLFEPEVHAVLRAAGETRRGLAKRNYAIVQLFLHTGLRVAEVASLKIADVDNRDRSGLVRVRHGKGEKEREVPLNASARRALRLYLESRGEVRPEEPLFPSRRNRPMPERSLQNLVAALARRAKVTRIPVSPHTFRHTFALNYLRDNPGKLVELAHLLGHESLDTVAIYTQPSTEELAEDLEKSKLNVYG